MKKLLALVLALVMTLGLATVSSSAAYSDAADVSLNEAVDVMSAVGVFQGADGKFSPKANLNREQAAKLIAYLDLGESTAEALPAVKVFSDVPATSWSAKYIAYCADAGYIAGDGTGKFNPTGELTGYAFGKMVLCVLGYDAEYEQFVGNNWSIKVAKLMETNGIADGIDTAASATLTREQAAQYCLNALQADMVEYLTKPTTIAGTGLTVTTGGSNATSVNRTETTATDDYTHTTTASSVGHKQLIEKLYAATSLKLYQDGSSVNGQKGYTWKISKNGKVSSVGDFVVDETVIGSSYDGTAIYAASGKSLTRKATANSKFIAELNTGYTVWVNGTQYPVYADGVATAKKIDGVTALAVGDVYFNSTDRQFQTCAGTGATASTDVEAAVGGLANTLSANGNGVLIELIDTDNELSKAEKIYVTTYRVDTVAKAPVVKESSDGTKMVYIDMATDIGNSDPNNGAAVKASNVKGYEGLVKDDVVTVTRMANGKYTVTKVEPVNTTASAKSGATPTVSLTIDGTAVKQAASALAGAGTLSWTNFTNFAKNSAFYYDAYGYGIAAKAVETAAENYLLVLQNGNYTKNAVSTDSNKSYVVFNDGTTATIEVSQVGGNTWSSGNLTASNSPKTGHIYGYVKNSDGTYRLLSDESDAFARATNSANYADANTNTKTIDDGSVATADTSISISKGVSTVGTVGSSDSATTGATLKGNADTVYVVRDLKSGTHTNAHDAGDYKTTWTIYKGYASVVGMTNVAATAMIDENDNYADLVFVYMYKKAAVTSDKTDYAYITDYHPTTVYDADGNPDYFTFDAIVDGQVTTIKSGVNNAFGTSVGLYVVKYTEGKVAAASDVTLVNTDGYDAENGYRYNRLTAVAKPEAGMIVTNAGSYSYLDTLKVFEISSSGAVTEYDADGYDAVTSGTVYVVNNNAAGSKTDTINMNILAEIYIQK